VSPPANRDYTFPAHIVVADDVWRGICDAIENPAPPNERLRALFAETRSSLEPAMPDE
jgi:hypothetical protein